MAITPLEQYGAITRTQDFSVMRGQEESKENAAAQHIQIRTENQAEEHLSQVRTADHAEMGEKRGDGSGYAGDGGRNRKKKDEIPPEGKVVLKGMGSFDMKI